MEPIYVSVVLSVLGVIFTIVGWAMCPIDFMNLSSKQRKLRFKLIDVILSISITLLLLAVVFIWISFIY